MSKRKSFLLVALVLLGVALVLFLYYQAAVLLNIATSSWAFVLAFAVAFGLAGIASAKVARRDF